MKKTAEEKSKIKDRRRNIKGKVNKRVYIIAVGMVIGIGIISIILTYCTNKDSIDKRKIQKNNVIQQSINSNVNSIPDILNTSSALSNEDVALYVASNLVPNKYNSYDLSSKSQKILSEVQPICSDGNKVKDITLYNACGNVYCECDVETDELTWGNIQYVYSLIPHILDCDIKSSSINFVFNSNGNKLLNIRYSSQSKSYKDFAIMDFNNESLDSLGIKFEGLSSPLFSNLPTQVRNIKFYEYNGYYYVTGSFNVDTQDSKFSYKEFDAYATMFDRTVSYINKTGKPCILFISDEYNNSTYLDRTVLNSYLSKSKGACATQIDLLKAQYILECSNLGGNLASVKSIYNTIK